MFYSDTDTHIHKHIIMLIPILKIVCEKPFCIVLCKFIFISSHTSEVKSTQTGTFSTLCQWYCHSKATHYNLTHKCPFMTQKVQFTDHISIYCLFYNTQVAINDTYLIRKITQIIIFLIYIYILYVRKTVAWFWVWYIMI